MSHKLFRTLGLAALVVGIGKLLRVRAWKMAGGPKGGHWAKHWHRTDGPKHPWFSHCEKWSEENAKTEPDAETGAAEFVV